MKLKELIKLSNKEQTIHLIAYEWRITASGAALEYCANSEVLNSTIKSIAAEDAALVVVCASCAEKEHYGCAGCRHEDKDFDQEPCKRCRYSGVGENECDLYEPKEGK